MCKEKNTKIAEEVFERKRRREGEGGRERMGERGKEIGRGRERERGRERGRERERGRRGRGREMILFLF